MNELPPAPSALPAPVVDAHTHLDACGATDPVRIRAALDRAAAVGVSAVVTVADDMAAARWVVQASSWDDRVFAAVALHPTRTATMTDADRAELERLVRQPRVVAVGETGLDYYWPQRDPQVAAPEVQRDAYR
ncbi:MAG: TatD family hydrolase, partial [Pseudonocardiaceae bacterium]